MEKLFDFLTLLNKYKKDIEIKHSSEGDIFFTKIFYYIFSIMKGLVDDINNNMLLLSTSKENEIKKQFDKLYTRQAQTILLHCNEIYSIFAYVDQIKKILLYPEIVNHFKNSNFFKRYDLQENLHHYICNIIFNNIDNRNPENNGGDSNRNFWVQLDHNDTFNNTENNRLNLDNTFDSGSYIRLSVLSEDCLQYDSSIFNIFDIENEQFRQVIREIYRPYYIEYYIDISNLNEAQRTFLFRDDINETWFSAHFIYGQEEAANGQILFNGVYAHSASPVVYKRRKLVIDDPIHAADLNLINKTYTLPRAYFSTDDEIKKSLLTIFKDVVFNKVRIYKVGNGNCVYSYGNVGKQEKRLLYDIGYDNYTDVEEHVSKKPFSYQHVINRIRKFIPSCIILSHWDSDHYKACAYGRKEIFECLWIAPDINNAGVNAKRLGIYLYKINKLMFVDSTKSTAICVPLTNYNKLTLYVGNNGGDLSKINCQGIAIEHENNFPTKAKIRCLMQGDVSYKSLPPQTNFTYNNPYEYLIVPHHGSEMDYSLLSSASPKDGKAVICCNNTKDRPTNNHLNKLNQCYDEVATTESAANYIEFNLRKRNCMTKF